MAIKALTDLDGELKLGVKGTQIDGDDSTALPAGFYVVVSVASSGSGLPTGAIAGYPFTAEGTEVPATGDSVIPMTFSDLCDVQNATFDITKDEYDITTLCNNTKVYAVGRGDFSGSLDGITKLGITDNADGIINQFVTKVTQSADFSTITVDEKQEGTIYLQLSINKTSTTGEPTAFYLMPVVLTSLSQGVSQGSAQTFTSGYRITSDADVKFSLYELEQPVA